MKILVLGATGMAGHIISLYFKEKGHDVVAYSRSSFAYCENIIGDVFDKDRLVDVLLNGRFDAVINCIGILNKDAEDNPTKAVYLNSYLPHFLVDVLKNTRTKLVHMSTDCVFMGNTGPYTETSFCDGRTFYDRTKAIGEVKDSKNLTFRNSIIGPDIHEKGIGLFNWFMKQSGKVNGYKGAIWTGVTTLTLAKAMEKALEVGLCGLYHLGNNESISKFELLQLFSTYFREESVSVVEEFTVQVDKSLRNTRSDFDFVVPSYEQMVMEMKDWVLNHHYLYKHYVL
jgi:dTDP-4-dehydrorhamnose reductase